MKILIAEDQKNFGLLHERRLEKLFEQEWAKNEIGDTEYKFVHVDSGHEALKILSDTKDIELGLIDKKLADGDSGIKVGLELQKIGSPIALILITADESNALSWRAPEAGFVAILQKGNLSNQVFSSTVKMVVRKYVLPNRGLTPWQVDPLTGLWLRRSIDIKIGELRGSQNYGIAVFDIDNFKDINDEKGWGHHVGDQVLAAVGKRIKGASRGFVGRLGGDEFVAIEDPLENMDQLLFMAERIRRAIGSSPITVYPGPRNKKQIRLDFVRISAGIASSEPGVDPFEILRRADEALYEAKARGKDQVVSYDPILR